MATASSWLDVAPERGLTRAEAATRLAALGRNALPAPHGRSVARIVADVATEPMFLMIVAAGILYLALGDLAEALLLLAFVGVVMGITIVQVRKTERVLDALRDLSSPRARVVRDGEPAIVAGHDVVPGDILLVDEGDRVAADAALIAAHDLSVDESLLTGEAVPVRKRALAAGEDGRAVLAGLRPGGDGLAMVYAGAMVVQGGGVARVCATGADTEMGKIGRALATVAEPESPLRRQTRALVRQFAIAAVVLSLLAIGLYWVTRGEALEAVLAGLVLAMSMLPEEFPVILTVFMAAGAWRIARRHVLTRRLTVIETLGAATVLCVDKTGTLTQNRMTARALVTAAGRRSIDDGGPIVALTADERALVAAAVLASEPRPFDPMDKALHRLAASALPGPPAEGHALVHEYALSPDVLAMTHVWARGGEAPAVVATKGAPEAVAALCRLDAAAAAAIAESAEAMAGQGMRVLGVARAEYGGARWPADPRAFTFGWLGLVAFADPLRPNVPQAIAECHAAGIRVVMITGDYPATARAIAAEAGVPSAAVLTGPEIAAHDDSTLSSRLRDVCVFARVAPEQKLRIVAALQAAGEVVAMTGDGVNDAPALKAAHIGIAMGGRGTDVAREAASLVLLDDDFVSIVAAVRLGRRIYANLRKAMSYALAVHVPIAGMALLPLLFGWPLMFGPAHIVFLELVINPTYALVFEAEPSEADAMQRPPRLRDAALFSATLLATSLLQGFAVLLVVAGLYGGWQRPDVDPALARAMAFVTLVAGNLAVIVANRASRSALAATLFAKNVPFRWVAAATLAALAATIYWPLLAQLFGFAAVPPASLVLCLAAGPAAVFAFEVVRRAADFVRRGWA